MPQNDNEIKTGLKVVYFDPNITDASKNWIGGTWIGRDNAEVISVFFERKQFQRMSCDDLGRWMNEVIRSGLANRSVAVFAQDIAPYNVLDDSSSNCLVRQYLDHGGTILWLGDIPFYYRTKWVDDNNRYATEVPQLGAIHFLQILGVIPISTIVASRSDLTRRGRKMGLVTPWASLRPIVFPSQIETNRTRIYNFVRGRHEFLQLAHSEGAGVISIKPFRRKGHVRRLFDFFGTDSVKAGSVEISVTSEKQVSLKDELEIEYSTKYLSGWIKIFNLKEKHSGFIRLWDFSPRAITEPMLNELYSVLKSHCGEKIESPNPAS